MTHIFLQNLNFAMPITFKTSIGSSSSLFSRLNFNNEIDLLKGLSFELVVGDRLAVTGPNGAGKSTLLKIISGVYLPTSGSLEVTGKVSSILDLGVGFNEEASGFDNIFIYYYLHGYSKSQIEARLDYVVEFSELGDFLSFPIRTYSSGMRARLAFSLATYGYPEIVVIDEIMGAGDESFMNKSSARIDEIIKDSGIVIFASHNKNFTGMFCNKNLELNMGKQVYFGDYIK